MSIEIGGVEVFSLDEVSKRLGVPPDALKRCMRRGELAARKIGDQWFITSQNLLAFLATPSAPSKRTAKHPKLDEMPTSALPEAASLLDPALPEAVAVPAAGEPAAAAAAEPEAKPPTVVTRPETVFPGELPPSPAEASPLPPTERDIPSAATTPGLLPSELKTEIIMSAVPHMEPAAPPPAENLATAPTHLAPPTPPPPPPATPPPAERAEAKQEIPSIAALFDMPLLPPDEPVLQAIEEPPLPGTAKEDLHAIAVEATRRRAMAKAGVLEAPPPVPATTPGQSTTRRTLLDSEELPVPQVDAPGSAQAPDTRPVIAAVKSAPPSAPGTGLSDIPNMFGPDSPTVLLTPEQVAADAARTKAALTESVEQGRIAQRAREEIVGTVRRLSMEEQSFALAGPIGEQLVKLDRLIEDGIRAQRELGLPAPPSVPNVITAIHRSPPAPAGPPPAPVAAKPPEESKWLPVEDKPAADPVPLIEPPSPPTEAIKKTPRPPSRVAPPAGVGGETWHEVGLPAPPPGAAAGKEGPSGIVRLTLALTDEEKRTLSNHHIAEETAVQEIMRRYQPTDEKGWADAKSRFFRPLKGKGGVHSK